MSDHRELKRLADAAPEGPWFGPEYAPGTSFVFDVDLGTLLEYQSIDSEKDACLRYVAAANPAVVKALIAENERLLTDLREVKDAKNGLSWAFGEIKIECDKLKTDNEALRKDAELYQQVQIAAGSLPSGWEIALRVENGCGGVDLIDPYGTVVDLDNVDESLSESIASAVAFAMSKEMKP